MIEFKLNGKDYSEDDLEIVIFKDNLKDKMELHIYNGIDAIILDDSKAKINVSIDVSTADDLQKKYEENWDFDASIYTIENAIEVFKKEIRSIKKKFDIV